MSTMKIKAPMGLSGRLEAPPSKSMSHRHLIGAALSAGTSRVKGLGASEDVEATLRALKSIGAEWHWEDDVLVVKGIGNQLGSGEERCYQFDCGESGSTLRFMIPIGMLKSGKKVYDGRGGLTRRPLREYIRNFDRKGIRYDYDGILPLETNATLMGGAYQIHGGESSQYLSGLLFALPLISEDSVIVVEGDLESKDYVDLTLDVIRERGIEVVEKEGEYQIAGGQNYQPGPATIEGDYSQAAFFIAAGLLGKEPLTIDGLNRESKQADRRMLEIVREMGGRLEFGSLELSILEKKAPQSKGSQKLTVFPSRTRGITIDARQCPDIIPILAVLASLSDGETRIVNGQRLRIKESDRIKSTVAMLKTLGADVVETEDGMQIWGKDRLSGGIVDSYQDHRIVMAASIAAIRCEEPVEIVGAEAVRKSYPTFFEVYRRVGGLADGDL